MNLLTFLQGRVLGELTVLMIRKTGIKIIHGRKQLEYTLPKAFQGYNYLNHTEEIAEWLQAVLQEEKIRIRRCKFVLDAEQIYLQTINLPIMTAQEEKNWVYWEGSQYIPFEQGTYQAVLVPQGDLKGTENITEKNVSETENSSADWQAMEEAAVQTFFLVSIPLERLTSLRQLAGFLKAELEEVTAVGPEQALLPMNLLPIASGKEVAMNRGYKSATILCLLLTLFFSVRGSIRWWRAENAWQTTYRQLVPLYSVKTAYEECKHTECQIQQYRQALQHIDQTGQVWAPIFRALNEAIPEGCWVEEIRQKEIQAGPLEITGCAFTLTQITEFLEKLKQTGLFSRIRLAESGAKKTILERDGTNRKVVFTFLFLAEPSLRGEEAEP